MNKSANLSDGDYVASSVDEMIHDMVNRPPHYKSGGKEYICKEVSTENGGYLEIETELIRCKDCKHRPRKDEAGRIRPPRVIVGFYDYWGNGLEPEYDDDMTCPYICDDSWYTRIPSDEQYCDRAEREEEKK